MRLCRSASILASASDSALASPCHLNCHALFTSRSILMCIDRKKSLFFLQYTPIHIYCQSVRSSISIAHQCPCIITLGFKVSREISYFHISCMSPYLKCTLSRSLIFPSLLQLQERGNLVVARDDGTKSCAALVKVGACVALHLFAHLAAVHLLLSFLLLLSHSVHLDFICLAHLWHTDHLTAVCLPEARLAERCPAGTRLVGALYLSRCSWSSR
jgi:hypothetical protein